LGEIFLTTKGKLLKILRRKIGRNISEEDDENVP